MIASAHSMTFDAIGTRWNIESDHNMSTFEWSLLESKVHSRIEDFDKTYSRFREDSLVTAISKTAGTYHFPEDSELLFTFYRQMYDVTDGKVTPLVGDLLVEAGYDAQYSLQPKSELHAVSSWEDTMVYLNQILRTKKPLVLDVGAAGKGYLVDIIGELFIDSGVASFLIDGSGDMLRKSADASQINVGMGEPGNPEQAIGVIHLGEGSICASGVDRRQWAGLHHVMDPVSAEPVRGIIATWVVADTALLADGMATALFLTDPSKLQSVFTFEYCIVKSDQTFERSERFPAELFTGGGQ